jgi:hypothetical protein
VDSTNSGTLTFLLVYKMGATQQNLPGCIIANAVTDSTGVIVAPPTPKQT